MAEAITMALVGCGGMGLRHLHGLAELVRSGVGPGFEVTVLVDRDRTRAEWLAGLCADLLGRRPALASSLAEVAEKQMAEAADINTPTGSHHELALEAIGLGFHALVEKPLDVTIAGATALIEAAEAGGRVLAVAENVRREPVNRWARAALDGGVIGDLRFVLDLSFSGADSILLTPWRHRRRSGGILLDVGVHHSDVLEYIAGPILEVTGRLRLDEPWRRRPQRSPVVSAPFYEALSRDLPDRVAADAEDVAASLLQFEGGAMGQWTIHQAAHGAGRSLRVIYGSAGSLEMPADRSGRLPMVVAGGNTYSTQVELCRLAPRGWLKEVEARIWGDSEMVASGGDFALIDRKLVAVELADFATAIRTGVEPEVGAREARRNIAVVYAVGESSLSGTPVAVAEVEAGARHLFSDLVAGSQ